MILRLIIAALLLNLCISTAFTQQIGVPSEDNTKLVFKQTQDPFFTPHQILLVNSNSISQNPNSLFPAHPSSYCPILPGSLPGFRHMHCTTEELDHFGLELEACLAAKFGINQGLAPGVADSEQSLLSYQQPMINASWLHKNEVNETILKQLKREQWDFSGVVEEVIMRPPGFGGK